MLFISRNRTFFLYLLSGLLFFYNFLWAESEITFYSQPTQLSLKNLRANSIQLSNTRQILPLVGKWNLYNLENHLTFAEVNIPSVFHLKHPFGFRKTFPQQMNSTGHYILHFEGINGFTNIRVNRRLFFSGTNNFLPIRFEIDTNLLSDSTNLVELSIFPEREKRVGIPPWFPISMPRIDYGVYGNVYLEILPSIFISEVNIKNENKNDSLILYIKLQLNQPNTIKSKLTLNSQISRENKIIWQSQFDLGQSTEEKTNSFDFQILLPKIEFWSLEHPNCYALKLSLFKDDSLSDEIRHNLPIRTISSQTNKLMLNGQPIKINGINYLFQDSKGLTLQNQHLLRGDLIKIKSMGFNAIRVAFYPQSSPFYSLTDSLGLLVFQDLPFPFVYENFFKTKNQNNALENYITQLLNILTEHPSVICIGFPNYFANEFDSQFRKTIDKISERNCLVYTTSPIKSFSQTDKHHITMIEVVERNNQEQSLQKLKKFFPQNSPIILSGVTNAISYRVDSSAIAHNLQQAVELYHRLQQDSWLDTISGHFVLTYSDYFLQIPSLQAGIQNNFELNRIGIYDLHRNLKTRIDQIILEKNVPSTLNKGNPKKDDFAIFLFILFGLANLLFFMFLYRTKIEFGNNIRRSIRKPYGFFLDLYERRLIPYSDSLFLLGILAVNGAIISGSIFYYFRNNFYMDYLLSIFFPNNGLKLKICYLVWNPILFVPILTVLLVVFFLLFTLLVQIISLFKGSQVRLRQAIATSAWSAAHFVILLPVGMFFYNLLLALNSYWILFFVLLYFHVWYIERWQNGTRVMTEQPSTRVFLYSMLTFGIAGMGYLYYLEKKIELIQHLKFLINLFYYTN